MPCLSVPFLRLINQSVDEAKMANQGFKITRFVVLHHKHYGNSMMENLFRRTDCEKNPKWTETPKSSINPEKQKRRHSGSCPPWCLLTWCAYVRSFGAWVTQINRGSAPPFPASRPQTAPQTDHTPRWCPKHASRGRNERNERLTLTEGEGGTTWRIRNAFLPKLPRLE